MLPEITQFEETVTLVSDSGIQFMDFALRLGPDEQAGKFVQLNNGMVPTRLLWSKEYKDFYEPEPDKMVQVEFDSTEDNHFRLSMEESLKLFDGVWLPIPFLRFMPPHRYDEGPNNWSRMRLVKLPEPDIDGNTHRLTIAFDCRIMKSVDGAAYLAPSEEDVRSGVAFKLACSAREYGWFLTNNWIREWLTELYTEARAEWTRERLDRDLQGNRHIAHYLNLLSLLRRPVPAEQSTEKPKVEIPEIKVVANDAQGVVQPIKVDLVLDVGNSRTCGILVEDHVQAGSGMLNNYVLELRDLSEPHQIYNQAFESRVEFSKAAFGSDQWSSQSGRHDAFQWPTLARVGGEAGRLASRRRGTEGSTGLSSPKRYLWDEKAYSHGWRFNTSNKKVSDEPEAIAAPFSSLINDLGQALYLPPKNDMSAFSSLYSRSNLMTFMLAEVVTQALSQINSPAQRSRQGRARTPRMLNSITLTVPPGMPQAERSILSNRMFEAVGLVWKSLGWHEGDSNPFKDKSVKPRTPLPSIRVDWDEASCGQLVYLYNEISENFAGHPEEFFATLARPDKTEAEQITLATIDIGGGTTDLVITDYRLDRGNNGGNGANVHIVPEQRFRDGFKVAGDDILLDVIREFILPSFKRALQDAGVYAPDALMSRLCGNGEASAQERVLRQQLNLQVFVPLGLAVLKAYEQYDPETPLTVTEQSWRELLGDAQVNDSVLEFVNAAVRRDVGRDGTLDLMSTPLALDLEQVHLAFIGGQINITKVLSELCEVISHYSCDALLLTGRPSRLPGIQTFIRQRLPLPPGRILPLQNYRTGGWYPFHKNGLIDDPKSTASVGAMICLLCAKHSVPNFYFRTAMLKPYSIIKHFGQIDNAGTIKHGDVLYHNLTSDKGRIELPIVGEGEERGTPWLEMRGDMHLGYRQLAAERWSASPLYTLRFTPQGQRNFSQSIGKGGEAPVLRIRLAVDEPSDILLEQGLVSDKLIISDLKSNIQDADFDFERDLELSLNTMPTGNLSDSDYWLDSGNVKGK
ncbi:virulence factor SrfB [Pseudomonas sp. H9]|uniref:virulence factor SrfB n=1 Tax=Pseudomonas sp. H9 TaxID=483968 RepID=UPI001057D02C|nr:virulence factor SrfB [Pseudomonas sp. H9]TDF79864.1 virulence factor SrfB [Pseudomonas sp. H9]